MKVLLKINLRSEFYFNKVRSMVRSLIENTNSTVHNLYIIYSLTTTYHLLMLLFYHTGSVSKILLMIFF